MRKQSWRVGLDIQPGYVRAVAVQQRRYGWQLRHWWHHPLPGETLREGALNDWEPMIHILSQWRTCLPGKISLRIALPVQRVMQLNVATPDARLREPYRSDYITANAGKQLPLSCQELRLDYRCDPINSQQLVVTAARESELSQWMGILAKARLYPEVIDITPCALQHMAMAAGLDADAVLLHKFENEWLWVSARSQPFKFGVIEVNPDVPPTTWVDKVWQHCGQSAGSGQTLCFSSVLPVPVPEGMIGWSPLSAFKQMQPPLPAHPAAFVLAGGLAVRPDDL